MLQDPDCRADPPQTNLQRTIRRGLEGVGLAQRDVVSEHHVRVPMSL
jgi:hypothetical protein